MIYKNSKCHSRTFRSTVIGKTSKTTVSTGFCDIEWCCADADAVHFILIDYKKEPERSLSMLLFLTAFWAIKPQNCLATLPNVTWIKTSLKTFWLTQHFIMANLSKLELCKMMRNITLNSEEILPTKIWDILR